MRKFSSGKEADSAGSFIRSLQSLFFMNTKLCKTGNWQIRKGGGEVPIIIFLEVGESAFSAQP
jgi:hypothetical protein